MDAELEDEYIHDHLAVVLSIYIEYQCEYVHDHWTASLSIYIFNINLDRFIIIWWYNYECLWVGMMNIFIMI